MATNPNRRMEVKPEVVHLGELLDKVTGGRMRVPRFQRPYVWRNSQMLQLLESVMAAYPIGSILLWDTSSPVHSLSTVGPIDVGPAPEGAVSYILDGQQRVSTLVGTLRLAEHQALAEQSADGVDWRVYYDLETEEFVHAPHTGLEPWHFPIRSLLSTAGYLDACRSIQDSLPPKRSAALLERADRLANAFRDYKLPTITIRDASLDTAVTVFARLNQRGRKMTADQMVSALTYKEGEFHLADRLDEFQSEIAHLGFGGLGRVFLLRAVLAAMGRDIYAKDWEKLMVDDEARKTLPGAFDAAMTGARAALNLLVRFGVTSDRLLPYGLQFVLLAEFLRIKPKPSKSQRSLLERWFWVTSFTNRFGGVSTTDARRAIDEMRELARGERTAFDLVDLAAPAGPFPNQFDARSARVRAFMLYLSSLAPMAIRGTGPLRPGPLLSELGHKAVGYLVSNLGGALQRSPANRMYLDREHTGQAWDDIKQVSEEILSSHGFSTEAIAYLHQDRRQECIEARLGALLEGERRFLGDKGVTLSARQSGDVLADSDASESDEDP